MPTLSHLLPVASLSGKGREVRIIATDAEKAALSEQAGILSISRLEASFYVTKGAGALIAVQGQISADVSQACSVTLDPVTESVEADIALTYTLKPSDLGKEIDLALDDEDLPEPIEDGQIDFGALVAEYLILNLNPYPRADGASFNEQEWSDNSSDDQDLAPANPFAALSRLKKGK
ncbi:MAG: DUF177 domain-containing protein [Rhodospirillaceae bacterium]|jgi:uncharacterized metal-binding protein YceD (DUF177 family)